MYAYIQYIKNKFSTLPNTNHIGMILNLLSKV